MMLPASAVGMVIGYGFFMQKSISMSWGDKRLEVDNVTISREALVAHNPRYTGFDKQGGAFEVRAATAEQDHKRKGFVRLNGIDGQLVDQARQTTTLRSPRGTFDTNSNVLELYERIDVASQNGMTAELTRATVYTKENRIQSDEPVTVRMPTGTVRGKAMTIEQKKKVVLFSGGVVANLQPQPKAAGAGAGDAGMRGTQARDGKGAAEAQRAAAPVDITSQSLLIDDTARVATFQGNVVARQTDQVMETAELQVSYEGQAQGGQPPGALASDANRLRRLVSPREVVLTRGAERVTGSSLDFDAVSDRAVLTGPVVISGGPDRGATSDRAEMDNKSDTILLTGNVVVTQQKNVLKGRRLFADRKAGTVTLSSPGGSGHSRGQISAKLYQSDGDANAAAKKGPSQPAAAPKATSPLAIGVRSDPSQPIDIDADTLDVDDKKKTAIFRGRVKAVQGDYVINTEELVAHYTGDGGMALGTQGPTPAAGQQKGGAQLTQVVTPRKVDILAKDGQRARGNSAVFDPKTNKARLTGDVVLSQGTSITTGNCADLDMTTGLMKIIDACGFATGGASAAVPSAGNPILKGRAQAVFVPGMLKEEQKASREKAKGAEASGSGAPASAATGAASPGTAPAAAAQPPRTPTARPRAAESDFPPVFGSQ